MDDFTFLINLPYKVNDNFTGIILAVEKYTDHYKLIVMDKWYEAQDVLLSPTELKELLTQYKLDILREERRRIIAEKGIRRLTHFTKVENLPSILEYGLVCRETADLLFDTSPSDQNRIDSLTEYVNTSLSFPNYKMFYRKRQEDLNQDWIVLSINPDVIVQNVNTLFFKTNAAKREMLILLEQDPLFCKSNEGFLSLFNKENRSPLILDSYPTDPQAEILVGNSISENDITGIFISQKTSLKNRDIVQSLSANSHIDYHDSELFFGPRKDYHNWR